MAKKTIDIDLIISGQDSINNVKTQMRALQQEAANLQLAGNNEEQLQKVITKLAEMKDQVNDANERIGILTAGSPFEKLSNNIGDVGSKIASLDFEGARESAQRMVNITKTITFKEAMGGLKDLGKTFISVGRAILTNPLFLLAAVIGAIGYAIYKLLDALGFIKKIMKAVGDVVQWLVDLFYSWTDALGITDKAGEKMANNTIERNKAMMESEKERSESVQGNLSREMRVLEAQGKDTTKIQIKIAKDKRDSALSQMKSIADIIDAEIKKAQISGEMDDETRKRIKELRKEYKGLVQEYRNANTDIQVINIKSSEDDKKENAKSVEDAKKTAKEKAAAHKAYLQDRLSASRQIQDLENALIEDANVKELTINRVKYERLIEDTLANEKLISSEKKKLKKLYEEELIVEENKIKAKQLEDANKSIEEQKKLLTDFNAYKITLETNEFITQQANYASQLESDKLTLQNALNNKLITNDEYNSLLQEAEQNHINKVNELRTLNDETTEQELQLKYEAGLISEEDFQNKLNEIKTRKAKEASDAALDAQKKEYNDKLNVAQQYFDGVSSLANSLLTIGENNAKKDEKAKLESAKKRFKVEKALAIVQTGIQGARAIVEASPNIPLMAFAGLTTIASIAAISSKQFNGESSSSGSSTPSVASNVDATQQASPAFNLFGGGNNANNIGAQESATNNNQGLNVNVSISESEITNTQSNVASIKSAATL